MTGGGAEVDESRVFTMVHDVRYFEADQQGVVFNMWYLAYFEDARNGYLDWCGYSLQDLLASGHDIQVVRTEVGWRAGARWPERIRLAASVAAIGRTSVTFDFEVRREDQVIATGRTVYVIIGTDGSGKRSVPQAMREAIGEPRPLRAETGVGS